MSYPFPERTRVPEVETGQGLRHKVTVGLRGSMFDRVKGLAGRAGLTMAEFCREVIESALEDYAFQEGVDE